MSRCPLITAIRRVLGDDSGQITALVVILLPVVLVFGGLVYDGGAALDARTRALDIAESAARAGAQQLDLNQLRTTGQPAARLDPNRARSAAEQYLHHATTTGTAGATPTTVTVAVTSTADTHLLAVIGIRTFTVHATATAHPQQHP